MITDERVRLLTACTKRNLLLTFQLVDRIGMTMYVEQKTTYPPYATLVILSLLAQSLKQILWMLLPLKLQEILTRISAKPALSK